MSEINRRLLDASRFFALAAFFFVPASVALVNAFVALFALSVFLNRHFWLSLQDLWRLPVVKAAMLLFLAFGVAAIYSSAPLKEALDFGTKYQKKLLLVPLLIWVFGFSPVTPRIHPRWVLLASWTLVLALSYVYYLRAAFSGWAVTDAATVFTDRISQSVGVAFLFCVAVIWAAREQGRRLKIGMALIAVLAMVDVLFLMDGRTGQVCLIAVAVWLLLKHVGEIHERNRIRSFIVVGLGVLLIAGLAALTVEQRSSRMAEVETEISQHKAGAETSSGQRLEFYSMSLKMIREHPLIGTGTGSVGIEFERAASRYGTSLSGMMRNAHNEYLMMLIQMGVPGLLLFVWLLACVYRSARQLPAMDRNILQAYAVIFAIGCMPNAFLTDFNEGHSFVFLAGIFLAPLYRQQQEARAIALPVAR